MNFGVTALLVPYLAVLILYGGWLFLSSCILTFIEYMCFKLIGSAAFSVVMVVIVGLALLVLLIFIMALLMLWAPVILVSGYGITDSWYYQLKLLTGKITRFALAIAVSFAVNGILVTCFGLFLPPAAMVYINILCYTFTIVYLIGLAMTSYFKLSDTPRKDIKKKYYM